MSSFRLSIPIRRFLGPTALLVALGAIVFTARLGMILRSEPAYVAVAELQDDSYYYLQPAWLFKTHHQFTFDGEHLMYGFQPLWMLLLTLAAFVAPNKSALLNISLILGSALYVGAAFVLYQLCREWFKPSKWAPVVAPGLWLANVHLLKTHSSGKENALYALLLLGFLLTLMSIRLHSASVKRFLGFGLLAGLVILTRTNALPFVAAILLLGIGIAAREHRSAWRTGRCAAAAVAALLLPTVPWFAYARSTFGSLLPSSGIVKLLPIKADLAYWLHSLLPALTPYSLLSALDLRLLQRPEHLHVPNLGQYAHYVAVRIPKDILAHFLGTGTLGDLQFLMWPIWGSVVFVGLGAVYYVLVRGRSEALRSRAPVPALVGKDAVIEVRVLILFALLNSVVSWLTLAEYLSYGSWYLVPEFLTGTVLVSVLIVVGSTGLQRLWRRTAPRLPSSAPGTRRVLAVCGALAAIHGGVLLVCRGAEELQPHSVTYGDTTSIASCLWEHESLQAARWMTASLPPGSRIGSWNAGILGYFTEGHVIVNLDGLANSCDYARTVVPRRLLYERGLSDVNPIWEYLQGNRIDYIADAWYEERVPLQDFHTVPAGRYEVLYEGKSTFLPERWRLFVLRVKDTRLRQASVRAGSG